MMHHHNPTTQPITTRVKINLEALESPIYTRTDTFTAYTGDIAIPPATYGHGETRSCPLPSGATFWRWSMRTHQHAFDTAVLDGQTLLYGNDDWTTPGASLWPTPPFQTFVAPKVTYSCSYINPSTRTIGTGPGREVDEQCIAVGYFFPADRPRTCYSGFMLD